MRANLLWFGLLGAALCVGCGDDDDDSSDGDSGGSAGSGQRGGSGGAGAGNSSGGAGSSSGGASGNGNGGTGDSGGGGTSAGGASGGDAGSSGTAGSAGNPIFTPGPSCQGLTARCGPAEENCCTSMVVPGGTFNRSNDSAFPATVSDFRLDKYEATVGRFRKFVDAYPGSMPASGSGKNPNNPSDPGFTFNDFLPDDADALREAIVCDTGGETWSDMPLEDESMPMNCVDWYVAYAFCIWDGGRLPTEAEWNYAAAGGSEQRPYPWSTSSTDEGISAANAIYSPYEVAEVGSKSPAGDGRWGHSDLAGNLEEWTQDVEDDYIVPCNDCANVSAQGDEVRGGSFQDMPANLLTSVRDSIRAIESSFTRGFRCVRAP